MARGRGTVDVATLPVKVPPAYEVVLDRLRRSIHLGIYGPGDKLPPERLHAEQLGVSRVTLREAIRVLEGERYVMTRRGASGGVVVLDRQESKARTRARLRESLPELEAILEFRVVNERLAAERAATRLSDQDLAALGRAVTDLAGSSTLGEFRHADSRFHLTIARAAECDLLRQAVEDARAAMFMPLDALDYELMKQASSRSHRRILAALEARDAPRAGRAMATHVKDTNRELYAVLGLDG